MQPATPAAPAVRETLERLLSSETFSRSERARELLRYLVESEQAGESDRLKGFTIAVDVFGKDTGFDPSTDALVRVQAGRLRELLQQYFSTEGASEPIRIVIPRGGYVPAYETRDRVPAPAGETSEEQRTANAAPPVGEGREPAAAPPSQVSIRRQLQFMWTAIVLLVTAVGALLVRPGDGPLPIQIDAMPAEPAVATSSIAQVAVDEALPVVYIALKDDSPAGGRVSAALRSGLSGFDTIDFIGREADLAPAHPGETSFVFEVLPGPASGAVTVELQNVGSGRVLMSRNLTLEDTDPAEVEDKVAGMLSSTVPASGIIYGYIDQLGLEKGLVACLLLNDAYYLDQNAGTHEAAYRCLETMADAGAKSPLVYSELAVLHLEAVTDGYAYPPGASAETALTLAHRALQIAATSPYAHRAYGYINSRIGNSAESIRWMRKAYELNTYDLSMAAAYGYGLIFAGDYIAGTPIIQRAVEESSAHPTWWDYGLFLGAFMVGDRDMAARATQALTPTEMKSHYLAARVLAARFAGDDALARALVDELTARFPKFAADPRKVFAERRYPADLTDRLVEALRDAGLGSAT